MPLPGHRSTRLAAGGCLPSPAHQRARDPAPCTRREDLPTEALSFWVRGGWSPQPLGCGAVGSGGPGSGLHPSLTPPHNLPEQCVSCCLPYNWLWGLGVLGDPLPRNPPRVCGTRRAGRPRALTPGIACRPPLPLAWGEPRLAPPPPSSGAQRWLPGPPVGTPPRAGRPVGRRGPLLSPCVGASGTLRAARLWRQHLCPASPDGSWPTVGSLWSLHAV